MAPTAVASIATKLLNSDFPQTIRSVKGSPLTWEEADKNTKNFGYQDSLYTEKVLYRDDNYVSQNTVNWLGK